MMWIFKFLRFNNRTLLFLDVAAPERQVIRVSTALSIRERAPPNIYYTSITPPRPAAPAPDYDSGHAHSIVIVSVHILVCRLDTGPFPAFHDSMLDARALMICIIWIT